MPLPEALEDLLPAAFPPLGPCMEALEAVRGNTALLAEMLVATGKDLPFDAGKYATCMNIKEQFGYPTKFFIVTYVVGDNLGRGEIGVCLPAACKNEDIVLIKDVLAAGNGTVARIAKGVRFPTEYTGFDWPQPPMTVVYPNPFNDQDDRVAWGSGTTAAIAIFVVVLGVVVYCTVAERRLRVASPAQPTLRLRLIRCFALLGPDGSWAALVKAEPYRPSDCLNGLRVLSMIFVIIGHTLTQPLLSLGFRNAECVQKTPFCLDAYDTSPLIDILFAGDCGVDTFFFIGGFLLSFVGMSRSTPVLFGTALRYARLLPCLGFVMMIYVLIAPYWTFGPFSPRFQNDVFSNCSNNTWWAQLLFISSLYPWNMPRGGCMGWSWYLGLDMMFAILGLALLNVWKRLPIAAWVLVFLMTAASLVVTVQQSLHYNLSYSLFGPNEGDYQFHLYSRFYARLPVFFVGLCAPWAMRSLERGSQPRSWCATALVMLACLVAVAIGACCIFLPALNSDGPGPSSTARKIDNWTPWENALFIAFSRPLWALACLVIILACYYEYLPLLDKVLSHRFWAPLTKLTYGAYLLHPVIIKSIAGSSQDYYRFSYAENLYRALSNICLAYSASAILWCLVERPMASLTGFLVPKRQSKPAREPSPCAADMETPLSCGQLQPSTSASS